uniref:Protein disulfide-isomerase n=1 Tax=Macrostomum lignano TaxID=282301 RepID=A0A1I8HTD0_9PLAT
LRCGHCQRLAPEYEAAATRLKDVPVPLAKVDCTAETTVCGRFGVSGYPTLKIFKGGEFSADYQGPRDTDGIVKYMKTKAGPSSRLLAEDADFNRLLDGVEPFIAGFFTDESSQAYRVFKKAADSLNEDFSFAHSLSAELNSRHGFEADSIAVVRPRKLRSKFEPDTEAYAGSMDAETLKHFGLAGQRTASNSKHFNVGGLPLVTAYYSVDHQRNAKGTNYWRNRLMKIAKKHAVSGLRFCIANAESMRQELAEFGVQTPDEQKVLVTIRDTKGRKFVMAEEFSMETFDSFLHDFLADRLTPYLKSEPVPESQPDPVKVVVANNFDSLVNDPAKDVLIEFYAPWCGHCKSLAPKYEELAQKLAKESGIVIAKMDATANDVPQPYSVRGFPTIYFAPRNDKANPRAYEGGREVKDFINYLAREATDELDEFDRSGNPKKSPGKQE